MATKIGFTAPARRHRRGRAARRGAGLAGARAPRAGGGASRCRARITSQVGRKPIRNTISSSIGSLMSAWMSPHRFKRHRRPVAAREQRHERRRRGPRTGSSGIASACSCRAFRRAARHGQNADVRRARRVASPHRARAPLRRRPPAATARCGAGRRAFWNTATRSASARFALLVRRGALGDAAARSATEPAESPAVARRICGSPSLSPAVAPRHRLCGARPAAPAADDQAGDGRPGRRDRRERPHHFPQGLWRDARGVGRSGHAADGVPLGVVLEGPRRDDGRQARRAGQDRPQRAGRQLRARPQAARRQRISSATSSTCCRHRLGLYRNAYANKLEEGEDPSFLRRSLAQLNAVCAPGTCWSTRTSPMTRRARSSSRATGLPYEQAVKRYLFNPIGMTAAACRCAGLESTRAGPARTAPGGARGRWSTPITRCPARPASTATSRTWRCGWKRRWARCRTCSTAGARHHPCAVGRRRRASAAGCASSSSGSATAWYGFGWRSYDYAGHRIVGHRGGIKGYRSLILFDPRRRAASSRCGTATPAAGRPRVRSDGQGLSPAVPRLDGGRQGPGASRRRPRQQDEDSPTVASAEPQARKAHG